MLERLLRPIRFVVWLAATVAWAVLGFLVWIPFLLRLTVHYLLALLSAVLRESHLEEAEEELHHGITFYLDGFRRTLSLLRPKSPGERRTRRNPLTLHHFLRLGSELAYTAVFWMIVALVLGGLPVRASGVCIPGTTFCVARRSADASLVGVWQDESAPRDWYSLTFSKSGKVTIEPRGSGQGARDSEGSTRSGQFYTQGDTLLLILSSPSNDILRLRYRVTADGLTLSRANGVALGTFSPLVSSVASRVQYLARVIRDWGGEAWDLGRELWEQASIKVRALMPS